MTVDNPRQKRPSKTYGKVNHPDASRLLRPSSIKGPALSGAFILVIAAILLGAFGVYKAADGIYFSEIRSAEQVEKKSQPRLIL